MYIAFAPGQILGVTGIHQEHLEARLLQDLKNRDPIDARANLAWLQPIRHGLQFARRAAEVAHRLVVATRGHGDIMRLMADSNASGIEMHHLQADLFPLQSSRQLPTLLAVHLLPRGQARKMADFLCLGDLFAVLL